MAMLSRSSRNEEREMSKGIINKIGKVAELDNIEPSQELNISDEQPTLADLVLPGTGYKFSDEFACLLKVLGGESA
jgi:hypothetical protein